MTDLTTAERLRQPPVKRLGFDGGWHLFHSHFLNLGLPLLFVDICLVPLPASLGLEPFGTRKPTVPLPQAKLSVAVLGPTVRLHPLGTRDSLLAAHSFEDDSVRQLPPGLVALDLMIGDSYAVQLGWSALWTCHIGVVECSVPVAPQRAFGKAS